MSTTAHNPTDENDHTDKHSMVTELEDFGSVEQAIESSSNDIVWIWGEDSLVYSRVLEHIRESGWKVEAISSGERPYFWIVPKDN